MCDVIDSRKVKARKEYRCDWCGEPIHRGETYARDTIVNDGEIYTWHSHDECQELASLFINPSCRETAESSVRWRNRKLPFACYT